MILLIAIMYCTLKTLIDHLVSPSEIFVRKHKCFQKYRFNFQVSLMSSSYTKMKLSFWSQ